MANNEIIETRLGHEDVQSVFLAFLSSYMLRRNFDALTEKIEITLASTYKTINTKNNG